MLVFTSILSAQIAIGKQGDLIEVTFTNQLTWEDLHQIKLDLAAREITLDYVKLEFNEEKKLISLDFEVDCNDNYRGGASGQFYSNKNALGFHRDYQEGTESPFGAGAKNL